MILLPFEKLTYHTWLTPEEVIERLEKVVRSTGVLYGKTGLLSSDSAKTYTGSINPDSFLISRIISNKNSYLPRISGKVKKDATGSEIKVKMRMSWSTLVFTIFWLCFVAFFLISSLGNATEIKLSNLAILIPFIMLVFGYVMMILGFKSESIKSKKFLAELFEAETGNKNKKVRRKRYLK